MKQNRIVFFILGWIGMLLYFTQRWIFGPLIPPLMEEFHTDRTSMGIIGAASLWGYMRTPIAAGVLSDRFGRKHTITFGIFGFSLLTVVCGLSNGPGFLFFGRFLTGMVEAFYFIPMLAFTLELFPERPGFFLTALSSGSSLGWFVGPALSGWLLDLTGSWRVPFFVAGLAGILVAILLFTAWPDHIKTSTTARFLDRAILKRTNLVLLVFLSLTGMFQISTEFGFTMWYPAFLKTELGFAATTAGLIAGLYGVGQCVGRPILGCVSDKLGYRRVGISCAFIMGVTLMIILATDNPVLRAYCTFQAGFIGAAMMGAVWTFTGLIFPTFKGLALGVITTFGYATASLAPISIGYIGDRYSISTGLWVIAVPAVFLGALSLLATFFIRPTTKR
jgi:MFS family permease